MVLYPLKLSFHVRQYAFGERLIPDMLGKEDVPDGVVAETWEISDYKDTSATITNGVYEGESLRGITQRFPDELVGQGWRGPHFPLLGKFLDASHMLPVHLHADDETAQKKYGEPNGKTEAWHILWAAEGASILAGIKEGVSDEALRRAFLAQDYDAVMPRMPIKAGDTVYVPGCILHSFGPDTLIFEIQQTSDLGSDVMPHDLYGNALSTERWHANIDETLDELKRDYQPRPNAGLKLDMNGNTRTIGCASPYFVLERWSLSKSHQEPAHPWRCLTLSNVGNPVRLSFDGATETLNKGESCIVPAALAGLSIEVEDNADLIACYVPDLFNDVIKPLRAAGYAEDAIASLGDVF